MRQFVRGLAGFVHVVAARFARKFHGAVRGMFGRGWSRRGFGRGLGCDDVRFYGRIGGSDRLRGGGYNLVHNEIYAFLCGHFAG